MIRCAFDIWLADVRHSCIWLHEDDADLTADQFVIVECWHVCTEVAFDLTLPGAGAVMVIESLNLAYHLACFRCHVCQWPLGSGRTGTDVRVRVSKLHCANCYSNDEGISTCFVSSLRNGTWWC